jgi:hypothetical protein
MSDRYYALTVLLERPIKDEDAAHIIEAIRMIRGVLDVQPHIATADVQWAQETAKRELGEKLWKVLYP